MPKSKPRVWFPAKRFGWGPPVAWQGWAVLGIYFAAIALMTALFLPSKNTSVHDANSGSIYFIIIVLALTLLLIVISYKKGERPSWQWGDKK